jgi:hypothetical protein
MENQVPVLSQESSSKKKLPKFLLIVFVLVILILTGEGIYYLYLRKLKISYQTPQSPSRPTEAISPARITEPEPEAERYFEGARYYQEVAGEKRLLVLEGIIDKINEEEMVITLKNKDVKENVLYTESDLFYLFDVDNPLGQKEVLFSAIEVGDFVSYNPVDESVNREQAIWLIQKQ